MGDGMIASPELSRRAGRAFQAITDLAQRQALRAEILHAEIWENLAEWAKDLILDAEQLLIEGEV